MDIKKRLPHEICYDAADEILRQRAEIERLRAALTEIANNRIDSELASREKRGMAQKALQK